MSHRQTHPSLSFFVFLCCFCFIFPNSSNILSIANMPPEKWFKILIRVPVSQHIGKLGSRKCLNSIDEIKKIDSPFLRQDIHDDIFFFEKDLNLKTRITAQNSQRNWIGASVWSKIGAPVGYYQLKKLWLEWVSWQCCPI